ncbi:hypothetical protein DEFDS_P111 (plasmid) [Deferribacter desulfuricans SSM1]|uniref:Uncharacterized protein n=1 Tax=Deferribacter desulfuricans (strain DSM 14783 / JCM 11476 / NBRC 101012 / SSM1) TaxID=639282 RepID=D3PEU1_DEFDS|nr:hypothetical protein [Deferribacter desulfuricans]BAI81733.1 hypothetical protein DEFDS_P111 [Deferribacter desulfuricans SSM1]
MNRYIMTYEEALEKVRQGSFFKDKKILKLANETGWTIAHEQAWNGWITEDKEILELANETGWTVAHKQAEHGWITNDKNILKLVNTQGKSVVGIIAKNKSIKEWLPLDFNILNFEGVIDYYDKLNKIKLAAFIAVDPNYKYIPKYKKFLLLKYKTRYIIKYKDYNKLKISEFYVILHHLQDTNNKNFNVISGIKLINKNLTDNNYIYKLEKLKAPLKNYFIAPNYIKLIEFYKKLNLEIKKHLLTTNIC